jgi:hypothetical protein
MGFQNIIGARMNDEVEVRPKDVDSAQYLFSLWSFMGCK